MKRDSHTVTIPAEDYLKLIEFYDNRPLYDKALTEIINNISVYHAQEGFNRAKEKLTKVGIELRIDRSSDNQFSFRYIKPVK